MQPSTLFDPEIRGHLQEILCVIAQNETVLFNVDCSYQGPIDTEFYLQSLFYPCDQSKPKPDPRMYRSEIGTVQIRTDPCSFDQAFIFTSTPASDWQDVTIPQSPVSMEFSYSRAAIPPDRKGFYSKQVLCFEKGQGIAQLNSFSPHEEALLYHTDTAQPLIFQYSGVRRQYRIILRSPATELTIITIELIVSIPNTITPIPEDIQAVIDDISSFRMDNLDPDRIPDQATGLTYLDLVREQRTGPCSFRTILLLAIIQRDFPHVDGKYIFNGCHAFPQLKMVNPEGQEVWHIIDLGGSRAKVKILDTLRDHDAGGVRYVEAHTEIANRHKKKHDKIKRFFSKELETWKPLHTEVVELTDYAEQCLVHSVKKELIKCPSSLTAFALALTLQKRAEDSQRPFFCVETPADLVCAGDYILRHPSTGRGEVLPGPGGPLYTFIQRAAIETSTPFTLLINYTLYFDPTDIVRTLSMIDPIDSNIDRIPIPSNIRIIGLIDPTITQGVDSDFYSRFNQVSLCPILPATLIASLKPIPYAAQVNPNPPGSVEIDMFYGLFPLSACLGQWSFNGEGLVYEKGPLLQALQSGVNSIVIRNGTWGDDAFIRFWQRFITLGYLEQEGERIRLPPDLKLIKTMGYSWPTLLKVLSLYHPSQLEPHPVLNPEYWNNAFLSFDLHEATQQLIAGPGLIEKASRAGEKFLTFYLTRALSEDAWAMLLNTCLHHQVRLRIIPLEGVAIASPIDTCIPPKAMPAQHPWPGTLCGATHWLQSTDPDLTIAQIKTRILPKAIVIHLNEASPSDLVGSILSIPNPTRGTDSFLFIRVPGTIFQALAQNQTVIITGTLSKTIEDHLASLLMQRLTQTDPPGQLIVVSSHCSPILACSSGLHEVTLDEKRSAFPASVRPLLEHALAREPFVKLRARSLYWAIHPPTPLSTPQTSDLNWCGVRELPPFQSMLPFDPESSLTDVRSFDEARVRTLQKYLQNDARFVVFTGPSGSGKTTFITQTLGQEVGSTLTFYDTTLSIKAWLEQPVEGPGYAYLIADDSFVSLNGFEGLLENPPTLMVQGSLFSVSPRHVFVVAMNPVSYGGDRSLSSFLDRHGHAIYFGPLLPAVIYERVIKPVFEGTRFIHQLPHIGQTIMMFYQALINIPTPDVLISPREAQMMALMILATLESNTEMMDEKKLKRHMDLILWMIGKELIPKTDYLDFELRFKPKKRPFCAPLPRHNQTFRLTESRRMAWELLHRILQLRNQRLEASQDAHRYGGLGAVIIKGPPAVGKSQIIYESLMTHGFYDYEEVKTFSPLPFNIFCTIPPGLPHLEKIRRLMEAFDNGWVVVIHEANTTLSGLEGLLNHLLMGRTPQDQPPRVPGFCAWFSFNPATEYGGRQKESTAIERRSVIISLTPYSLKEMKTLIRRQYHLNQEIASLLAEAYVEQSKQAAALSLKPAPTFRDLVRMAERCSAGQVQLVFSAPKIKMPRIPQIGHTCKLVVVAMVDQYWCQRFRTVTAIPVHKRGKHPCSIRRIAKELGSIQGELLTLRQLKAVFTQLGYRLEPIHFSGDYVRFRELLIQNLQKKNLIVGFMAVDRSTGYPAKKYDNNEHAVMITGIDTTNDQLEILHWGSTYSTSLMDFYLAANLLPKTREPEYYSKLSLFTRYGGNRKYELTMHQTDAVKVGCDYPVKKSITPNPLAEEDRGFHATFLVIQRPHPAQLLEARAPYLERPIIPKKSADVLCPETLVPRGGVPRIMTQKKI